MKAKFWKYICHFCSWSLVVCHGPHSKHHLGDFANHIPLFTPSTYVPHLPHLLIQSGAVQTPFPHYTPFTGLPQPHWRIAVILRERNRAVLGKPKPYVSLSLRAALTTGETLNYYFSLTRRSSNGLEMYWAAFPRMYQVSTGVIPSSPLWFLVQYRPFFKTFLTWLSHGRHFGNCYWFAMVQAPADHQLENYNWLRGRTSYSYCCGLEKVLRKKKVLYTPFKSTQKLIYRKMAYILNNTLLWQYLRY